MESTVTTSRGSVSWRTLVFLLIMNLSVIEPSEKEILKYFFFPRKTSSTAATAPDAVGFDTESCCSVVANNFFGLPAIASTIISFVLTHCADDAAIVWSNGFPISTFFENKTLKRIFNAVSVPFELKKSFDLDRIFSIETFWNCLYSNPGRNWFLCVL